MDRSGVLPYATVDLERAQRTGVPEVVYGAGKTGDQIAGILASLLANGQDGVATRVVAVKAAEVAVLLPDVRVVFHPQAGVLVARVSALEASGVRTLVFDEAHHLLRQWWKTLDRIKA